MKKILFASIVGMSLLTSCGIFKKVHSTDNYLPAGFEGLEFGMSKAEVLNLRPAMKPQDQNFEFRSVYLEAKPATNIESAVYYFDAEGKEPFYELIIVYPDMTARDAAAEALFGAPNKGGEWYFENKGSYPIKAWVFNEKLIVAALVPQTEWWEEAQKGVDDWK